jgi:hypothetical protein
MLNKKEFQAIAKEWKGTQYQKWDRYKVRMPTFLKYIDAFKGKDVLEVGCNAGIAGYEIAKVAKSYVGVEEQAGYYKQALQTRTHMENPNVQFLNMSIKTFMKRHRAGKLDVPVNACYLSYVLYHFDNKEVRLFAEYILPKLDAIIVQSRYARRGTRKGRRIHNDYKFWKPSSVEKYLQKAGFETKTVFGPWKKFHLIRGIRNADCGDCALHRAGEGEAAKGRGTRSREGRVAQRKPRRAAPRKASAEGQGGTVLSEG